MILELVTASICIFLHSYKLVASSIKIFNWLKIRIRVKLNVIYLLLKSSIHFIRFYNNLIFNKTFMA